MVLILAILQLLLIAGFLTLSGGLSYVREDSYDLLAEKTDKRRAYVENALNRRTASPATRMFSFTNLASAPHFQKGKRGVYIFS